MSGGLHVGHTRCLLNPPPPPPHHFAGSHRSLLGCWLWLDALWDGSSHTVKGKSLPTTQLPACEHAPDRWLGAQVDTERGALCTWALGGHQLLAQPLTPCLFRAPTDNDRGGSGGTSYVARQAPCCADVPSVPRGCLRTLQPWRSAPPANLHLQVVAGDSLSEARPGC